MRIGLAEAVVVIVVALALVRPSKLVKASHTLGQLLGKVRANKEEIADASAKVAKEVNDVVQPIKEVVGEIQFTIENGGKK